MLKIHSIETFGTHEGPGIRLVIFAQGCNFKCIYCENADTIPINGGNKISEDELIEYVKKEMPYFGENGGVTISGGEPLLQAKEIAVFFKKLKKMGIHTAIDTNGSVRNSDIEELAKYTDLFLPDIKQINNAKHQKLTGQTNKNTLKFIKHLEEIGKKYRIRYVLIPGFTDEEKDIEELGMWLSNHTHLERLEILPYHTLGKNKRKKLGWKYELGNLKSPNKTQINKTIKILSKYIKNIFIR